MQKEKMCYLLELNRNMMKAFLLLFCIVLNSCFSFNMQETARPAVTRQYMEYLRNDRVRHSVDRDWQKSNQSLVQSGLAPEPHPYGDKLLKKWGIEKMEDHKFSNK